MIQQDNPRQVASFRKALLEWFDANRRELPWRRSRDPYAIWLSEIMLQQTTVRTVEPRWQQFLQRFPDVKALAAAPLDDVLNEWTGLGYYARARNLHAAAKRIANDFNGRLPATFETLLALPGMGRYTAAAVASIAFGEAVAVMDANVERVIARLDAEKGEARSTPVKRRLWQRAQELLATDRPGPWNEAMMELGAMVCLPRAPVCGACPVKRFCEANRMGTPGLFPVLSAKPAMKETREVACIVRRGRKVLVLERKPKGSFARMWELPRGTVADGESARDAAIRQLEKLTGIRGEPHREVLRLKHVVMRRRIELHVWEMKLEDPTQDPHPSEHVSFEWLSPGTWKTRPISTTQKDIALFLESGAIPRRTPSKSTPPAPDMFPEIADK